MRGEAGQEQGPLARGVASAQHQHLLPEVMPGLGQGGAIVQAGPGQALLPRHLQALGGHAGGDQQRVAGEFRAVAQLHEAVRVLAPHRGRIRAQDLHPEALRLAGGAAGQVRAAQAPGETQVVLDHRAGARLAAGGLALHQHRAQPLGGGVHRRGQARGTAAHDHQVVERAGRRGLQAGAPGQGAQVRVGQEAAVGEQHQRQPRLPVQGFLQPAGLLVLLHVQPLVGDLVAGQEILDQVAARGPQRAQDADALEGRPVAPRPSPPAGPPAPGTARAPAGPTVSGSSSPGRGG